MLLNYFKIAWRQLWRNRAFSALNIFGLATSMAVCLLVILILEDQYGYDEFHDRGDHIYRVISATNHEAFMPTQPNLATTAISLSQPLQGNYDFVDKTTPVIHQSGFFKRNNKVLQGAEKGGFFVEQNFLDIFSFGWQSGEERSALARPKSIVLTAETANNFFPHEDPIGQTLTVDILGEFTVTGVLPNPPHRSHIQFDYLLAYSTVATLDDKIRQAIGLDDLDNVYRGLVYAQVRAGTTAGQFNEILNQLARSYTDRIPESKYLFAAQALHDVVPSMDLNNEIGMGTPRIVLNFLLVLAGLIMLTACFNYTNLTVARSLKRAREIGVRKVTGARRRDIAWQFLSEAIVIAFFALGIAMILLELLIPAFYQLDPFVATIFKIEHSLRAYTLFFLFSLAVGLVAGLLPSINISRFQPLDALKDLKNTTVFSRIGLRKALVTAQFTLSFVFILTVIIVLQQQKHILRADLGLEVDDRWTVVLHDHNYELFAQQVAQLPSVEMVSGSHLILLTGSNAEAMASIHDGTDSMKLFYNHVSSNYLANHNFTLVAGEGLPELSDAAQEQFVVLNETAVKRMGFTSPKQALGTPILIDSLSLSVIGVAQDFHHDNIWFEPIKPFALRQKGKGPFRYATLKLTPGYTATTLATINELWDQLYPDQPMHSYFVAERIYHLNKFFRMGSRIVGFVGLLTILISILGLLGMVIYTVEGRIKEVGIRKVLGASTTHLIWQLSRSFILLLAIAVIIGLPITLLAANMWLQNFYLRIQVGWWIPLIGIFSILFLGGLTVFSQAYLAALKNPVESLRTE